MAKVSTSKRMAQKPGKLRLLLGPIIILLGLIAFILIREQVIRKDERKALVTEIGYVAERRIANTTGRSITPATFKLQKIQSFKQIKQTMEEHGYVTIFERSHGPSHVATPPCKDWASGTMVFENRESHFIAISFDHRMSLQGCRPAVREIIEIK